MLAPGRSPSIFCETFWRFDAPDAALLDKWARLRAIRDEVNKAIEAVRAQGGVGSSLQAEVTLAANADDRGAARRAGRRPEVRADHVRRRDVRGRATRSR